jgi:hypothetical protein
MMDILQQGQGINLARKVDSLAEALGSPQKGQ